MKKLLTAMLALVLVFSLVACGSKATTLKGSAKGYNGDVSVTVTKDGDKITKVEVTETETPEIGGVAIKDLVAKIVEKGSADVEVVSGATVSSEALIKAVKEAK